MSSGVSLETACSGFFWMTVMSVAFLLAGRERAGSGRGVDAGLDEDVLGLSGHDRGDFPVAQVAHTALTEREDAAEADAHPAPARHEHAFGLSGVEDRGGSIRLELGV